MATITRTLTTTYQLVVKDDATWAIVSNPNPATTEWVTTAADGTSPSADQPGHEIFSSPAMRLGLMRTMFASGAIWGRVKNRGADTGKTVSVIVDGDSIQADA